MFCSSILKNLKTLSIIILIKVKELWLKKAIKLDEPTSFALLRIGSCYEKLKNNKLAVQYYYKTIHEYPLLDKGWIAITKFYNRKKKYQKALYYVNKAINIEKSS